LNDMNDSDTNVGARKSVVAIVKEDGRLKGVELRKRGGATEILWAKSAESTDADWQSFAAECGLSVKSAADGIADGDKTVVIGFGSAGTVFHRTSMPPVEEQEIESIVKLQAETRLPLPADQTELAWRADPVHNGQVGVTMVVARKDLLQGFVREVRSLDPTKILLDCEGIIKAWRTVFSEHEKEAVVVSMGARSTQVCLAQDGRLSNAVILDLGLEDLSGEAPAEQSETTDKIALDMGIDSFSAKAGEGQTEAAERFTRDMRSVMDLFGFAAPAQVPVFVLSDDSAVYVSVVSSLRSAALNARVVLPNVRTLAAEGESGVEWIYNYRAAIGLGLMAIEERTDELNIFKNVYSRFEEKETKHWLYSPKVAGAIACVMLLALAIVCYSLDMKSPKSIMQRLEASTSGAKTDLDTLVQRQRLIKMVARERPDILALLRLVNDCGEKGVVLDSVFFKKDQKVTVTGQVQSNDQLYKFQENLDKHKDVTSVDITNSAQITSKSSGRSSGGPPGGPSEPPGRPGRPGGPSGGPSEPPGGPSAGGSRGKGGTKFTITFQYKNFSKKATRAQG
jgi:hypothetical protein